MPLPHLRLSKLPSQNPQIPVTSRHVMRALSTHSSARPFAPLPAHRSASLVCSRKVWVTQSAVRCHKRIPQLHHSRRRFCAFSTVPIFVFILVWPFIQSTIVLLSPLISSVGFSPLVFQGHRSFGLLFHIHWLFHRLEQVPSDIFLTRPCLLHQFYPVVSLRRSISPSVCPTETLCCETKLCASTVERCKGPTPHPMRIDFSTMRECLSV